MSGFEPFLRGMEPDEPLALRRPYEELHAENQRRGDALRSVWLACPNYGSPGCVCGTWATPDPACSVHWAVAALERHGFDYHDIVGDAA